MSSLARKRILIATTGGNVTNALFNSLRRCGDFELVWVKDGQAAVAAVEAQPIDLIFMDLRLPVMDGWMAARRIRALERGGDVPLIALLCSSLPEAGEKALAAGWNAYLTHVAPWSVREMIEQFFSDAAS